MTQLLGCDFSSAPTRRKPIVLAWGRVVLGRVQLQRLERVETLDAFSALQFLDERAKGRFTNVFQARADAYKGWFKCAIELEREFGPDERTVAVQGSARSWTFQNFKHGTVILMTE